MYNKSASQIKIFAAKNLPGVPFSTAIVLGSGLGGFPEKFKGSPYLDYSEIEGFAASTAPGHKGRLYFLQIAGRGVYCFSGRVHFYEGKGIDKVVFPVRVMGLAGVTGLFLSNAAGGINKTFKPGELMLIKDHINFIPNPLVGANDPALGVRFPDMTTAYDAVYREYAKIIARDIGITLREGVYVGVTGPSYETPAEIEAYRRMGADAVGMSTVPEVIAARHAGIRVAAVSLIANAAAGLNETPLSEEEVIEAGRKAADMFGVFAEKMLSAINGAISL
ncbi:MAG: purine-nucleoside phosphorylase [Eubacteriales bacterium]